MKPLSVSRKHTGRFFNLRLFVEGLKRLRVTALAVGIPIIAVSALIPIVTAIDMRSITGTASHASVRHLYAFTICVPDLVMILLAPIFFFVLFSFLHKRKQSDFFHAIPYTRTCVYVSFTAAALVSVLAIQLIAAVVAGVLWSAVPYYTYDLGEYVIYTLVYMLGAVMLSSFMMLALTVSGTAGSSAILFFLFASITRIVLAIFAAGLESLYVMQTGWLFEASPLSPLWFYPLAALSTPFASNAYRTAFVLNPACVMYSILVTLAVFVLAGVLYKFRHSEMAGNPAPGKRTQTVFRVLFTLPAALLLAGLIISDANEDTSLYVIIFVGALLCYFLYELITTKRARNMGTAIPGLGYVLGACVVFSLVFFGARAFILNEDIDAEDIASVEIERNGLPSGIYQYVSGKTLRTNDPAILAMIADRYVDSQNFDDWNHYGAGRQVVLRLKNGRKLYRQVGFRSEDFQVMIDSFAEAEGFTELLYRLPAVKEVNNFSFYFTFGENGQGHSKVFNDGTESELMAILASEVATLTPEQKKQVFSPQLGQYDFQDSLHGLILTIEGAARETDTHYSRHFVNNYLITRDLPQTYAYLLNAWASVAAQELHELERTFNSYPFGQIISVELGLRRSDNSASSKTLLQGDAKEMRDMLAFLIDRMVIIDKEFSLTEDVYILYIENHDSGNNARVIVHLTQEDMRALDPSGKLGEMKQD